mgnify:CR=1 FL=1|jgi:predicted nucleotidyltransferase
MYGGYAMTLKELRKEKGLTQAAAAKVVGVPMRTYVRYESDENKKETIKYRYIVETLQKYGVIDEEHGLLTIEKIQELCAPLFEEYGVKYAYLFGSYAKGKATEKSDVDLLVSMPVNGLAFYELVERLRGSLKKKIDLLDETQLENNTALVKEILQDGIKIYG